jgi:excisionase family DNA binding protein
MTATTPTPNPAEQLGAPLLSLDDIAKWTSVPKSTLYSLIADGRGPHGMKLGRVLRFRPTAVDAWLDQLTAERSDAA